MPNAEKYYEEYEQEIAYDMDKFEIIDVVATIQKHVDQGISFETCVNSEVYDENFELVPLSTKELKEIYLYAWQRGIKTLYYTRTNKMEVAECESCVV